MLFHFLKIIHVISASVLFGTGLSTAFYMFYVNQVGDIKLITQATKQVVFADWLFTGSSGVIQAITGFSMVYIKQSYSFADFWVWASITGYLLAGACWLPVMWLQIRCRDIALDSCENNKALPPLYFRYFKTWWILGIPAFLALIGVYYLMANRPAL